MEDAILVADVGGTNLRIALARRDAGGAITLSSLVTQRTDDAVAQLDAYRRAQGVGLAAAVLGGAGPVSGSGGDAELQLTNQSTCLRARELRARLAAPVFLLNDFEAVAHCLPALADADLRKLGGGVGAPGAARAVIGPGTGLGMAALVAHGPAQIVLPGEGGHADLPLRSEDEWRATLGLRDAEGHLSAEDLLSGRGLAQLHAALAGGEPLDPAEVARRAFEQREPAAAQAVHLFTRFLGRVAGNFALATGARGGVYLAGGIVLAWGTHFDARAFRAAFDDNGRQSEYLRRIPCFLITHAQPALLGAARLGFEQTQ